MIIEITFTNKLGNSNKYGFGNIGDAIEFLNSINKDSHDVAGGLTTDAPACGEGKKINKRMRLKSKQHRLARAVPPNSGCRRNTASTDK